MGAVQTNYQFIQFAKPAYSGVANQDITSPAAPVVIVTENGQNIGAVPVTLSFSGTAPSSVSGNGPVTTVARTGANIFRSRGGQSGRQLYAGSLARHHQLYVTASNTATLNVDTPATVMSLTSTSAGGTYTTNAVISIQVNFSKTVSVTGTPAVALEFRPRAVYSSRRRRFHRWPLNTPSRRHRAPPRWMPLPLTRSRSTGGRLRTPAASRPI